MVTAFYLLISHLYNKYKILREKSWTKLKESRRDKMKTQVNQYKKCRPEGLYTCWMWAFKKPHFLKAMFLVTIYNVQKMQTNQCRRRPAISVIKTQDLSLCVCLSLSVTWGADTVQCIAPYHLPQ